MPSGATVVCYTFGYCFSTNFSTASNYHGEFIDSVQSAVRKAFQPSQDPLTLYDNVYDVSHEKYSCSLSERQNEADPHCVSFQYFVPNVGV